jgi:hypothetical protein
VEDLGEPMTFWSHQARAVTLSAVSAEPKVLVCLGEMLAAFTLNSLARGLSAHRLIVNPQDTSRKHSLGEGVIPSRASRLCRRQLQQPTATVI